MRYHKGGDKIKIRIVCIGRAKEEWKSIFKEFEKRISALAKLEVFELHEGEERKILGYVRGYFVVLDEKGREINSTELSLLLEKKREITFVIGGKEGLSEDVKSGCDFLLSISKMTFSHQLARAILLEQIYRALCILYNLPYAK